MKIYGHMWDSAAGEFPPGAELTAKYFNGLYAWYPYAVGRGQVWIDVQAAAPARCSILDVERGDARPQDVPRWLDRRNPVGRGVIYCDRSTLPEVVSYAGERPFDLWLSTLDGSLPPVTVPHGRLLAVQAWREGQADKSAVVDQAWWDAHRLARS